MKVALLCLFGPALALSSCTTLENRRDMYCGERKVMGPYTKMLRDGIPKPDQPDLPPPADFKGSRK